ncbi:general transcription factor II-I repeat domain-containing 2-like protein [Labeo rohita]|uniref:General transcription factor II-I repeat domain-containing 2-like protein n=2 Tax=Labeo rohita TaxID=84645 RepID=A0A498M4T9_LABRO|nr:General transcription factor II-I repeat domain-containing protein 2 [Labeo rohita]RXN15571.1 general transcription factor II-I repeat domain-containing 2-like protein [Labeo rohita]
MAEDLTQQLWKDITDCECFSLQLDESTDVSDTAQLCIFIRMVFNDMIAKVELLTVLPMKEHTRGEDIFQSFKNFMEKTRLPVCKLVSITTDRAMVGRSNGFIAKCREDDAFPDFLNYHCIIHQQALCAKNAQHERDNGCGNEDRLFYSRQISSKTAISCASGERRL